MYGFDVDDDDGGSRRPHRDKWKFHSFTVRESTLVKICYSTYSLHHLMICRQFKVFTSCIYLMEFVMTEWLDEPTIYGQWNERWDLGLQRIFMDLLSVSHRFFSSSFNCRLTPKFSSFSYTSKFCEFYSLRPLQKVR